MQIHYYQTAVLTLLTQKPRLRIVVVGANDGKHNDPIYETIRQNMAERVDLVLFEPQRDLIPYLDANYSFVAERHVINAAIGEGETMTLYTIRKDYWAQMQPEYAVNWPLYRAPSGVTSSRRDKVEEWVRKMLGETADLERIIEQITVPARRLVDVLEENGIPREIDVLQVDVEGEDDTAIHCCDIAATRPAVIHCETHHLGIERIRRLCDYLAEQGYRIVSMKGEALAIRKA